MFWAGVLFILGILAVFWTFDAIKVWFWYVNLPEKPRDPPGDHRAPRTPQP